MFRNVFISKCVESKKLKCDITAKDNEIIALKISTLRNTKMLEEKINMLKQEIGFKKFAQKYSSIRIWKIFARH